MTAIPGLKLKKGKTMDRCVDCGKEKRHMSPYFVKRGIGKRCHTCAGKLRRKK